MKYIGEKLLLRNLKTSYSLLFIIIITVFSSCITDDGPVNPGTEEPSKFVSYQLLAEISKNTLKVLLSTAEGFEPYADNIEFGVSIYQITYKTTYQGEEQLASGLISLPEGYTGEMPLLSAQHRTITAHRDAPSNFNTSNISGLEIFGALGYATLIPDFLGFGASKEMLHPYYNEEATATATIDMIFAGKEFLDSLNIPYNQQLFLVGYSEGGYATLATLKGIEENPDLGLQVTAAAAGAGGYDVKGMVDYLVRQDVYPTPGYLAFLIYSYQVTNEWSRPLTDFFQEPYASRIPELFSGELAATPIHERLNDTLSVLLNTTFLENSRNGTETQFMDALVQNSVYDWEPQTPLRLYHEQDDEVIPIENSQTAYDTMLENGSSSVTYYPYDLATSHGDGFIPMVNQVIPWFKSLKQ